MQFFSKNLFTSFKDFQNNDKKKKEKIKSSKNELHRSLC